MLARAEWEMQRLEHTKGVEQQLYDVSMAHRGRACLGATAVPVHGGCLRSVLDAVIE